MSSDNNNDFQKLIQEDREIRKKSAWKGNMLEYLEQVRESPTGHKLSHKPPPQAHL